MHPCKSSSAVIAACMTGQCDSQQPLVDWPLDLAVLLAMRWQQLGSDCHNRGERQQAVMVLL